MSGNSIKDDGADRSMTKGKSEESSSSIFEQVKLETGGKPIELVAIKSSENIKQVVDPEKDTSKRKRDARSYRKWIISQSIKDKVLGRIDQPSYGWVSKENEEKVGQSWLPCYKRQRLDFDSKQCSSFNAKQDHNLHGIFAPKAVHEEASTVRSPQEDDAAGNDAKDQTLVSKENDGSVSQLPMGYTEEYADDVQGEKPHLEIQTDGQHNACSSCNLGGKLLTCSGKGCKRSYHLSCLDPPLINDPPGIWHCILCVKKKIELGVLSVSGEVESIWDVRNVVSDSKVMQIEKQYLVKYQGLAHVHNCWIPETKLLLEAPKLVAKFNRKNQDIRWRTEWTVPHRLLLKRQLLFPKNCDEYPDEHVMSKSDCSHEWLVKWSGLGYEHTTWELENALFLRSPEALKLIMDYETRHQKGSSSLSEADKNGERCLSELSELTLRGSAGEYNCHLRYVNKLRACWKKNQNAVILDDQVDQERVLKVILFVLSLQFIAWKPFLIISTSSVLSLWESEFLSVAPSSDIIVYGGNKDVRSSIRSLEFYNESGCIMFQVLLASAAVVVEDLEILERIGWGAVVIDECQASRMSRHFEQIKMLPADMRLLLVSGQVKECASDYHNLLSLLDAAHGLNHDVMKIDSDTVIPKLKDIFAHYIAFRCNSDSYRFVEYWVPVKLSNLQLEQYCSILLSNSMLLNSHPKKDPAHALRDVIISTRKCCDHPYLLDQSLQSIITKGLSMEEKLDVEIKASGKLQLLDKILLESKRRGLRVLILFQSIRGSTWNSIGHILDDFICQRFGEDSYVCIYGEFPRARKQASVNLFNDKKSGRFVFLIEDRACLPSIKLSAVDIIILFDSNWNPQSDLKALQRITICSRSEQLKVFRLYSSCTVEEKVLILAKEGMAMDSNMCTLNWNSCHTLLSWGASYLFNKLDDFHGCCNSASVSNVYHEQSFLNDVLSELLTILPCNGESGHSTKGSIITEVPQDGVYVGNIFLFGEREVEFTCNESPAVFWKNLLKGKHPMWKFLSKSSSRIREKVQYIENPSRESEFKCDAFREKRIKLVNHSDCQAHLKWKMKGKRHLNVCKKKRKPTVPSKNSTGTKKFSCSPDDTNEINQITTSVAPGISDLCRVLQLPENVRAAALQFLDYITKDFYVSWEAVATSQAFQISVCWMAAALLDYKIDRSESLTLAKLQLNFVCKEEEADYIYMKLQSVKKEFTMCSNIINGLNKSDYASSKTSMTSDQQESDRGEIPMDLRGDNVADKLAPATCDEHLDEISCYCGALQDYAPLLDSPVHHCPVRHMQTFQSVVKVKPSEKTLCGEVVRDDGSGRITNTLQSNKERSDTSVLEKSVHSIINLSGGLAASGIAEGSQSVLQAEVGIVEGNSVSSQELPIFSVPSSPKSTLSAIPASIRIQHLSDGRHASIQEVQITGITSLQDQTELSGPAATHPSANMLVQPFTLFVGEAEKQAQNFGMQQLPISKISTSMVSNLSSIPASMGNQQHCSDGRDASFQEAQILRIPSLQDPVELSSPAIAHTSTNLQVQPFIETPVQNLGMQQLPISEVSTSMASNLSSIPASKEIQQHCGDGRDASCQETQVSKIPTLQDPVELSSPAIAHTSMNLPVQAFVEVETQVQNLKMQQLPISEVSTSTASILSSIPASMGIQHLSDGRDASCPEVQISRIPSLEDPVELSSPAIAHINTNLPVQPFGEVETQVQNLRMLELPISEVSSPMATNLSPRQTSMGIQHLANGRDASCEEDQISGIPSLQDLVELSSPTVTHPRTNLAQQQFPSVSLGENETQVQNISMQQLPCCTVSSSMASNLSAIQASMGIQHLSNGRHASCQEAQIPRQSSLQELVGLCSLPVIQSIRNLPMQPFGGMSAGENDTQVQNLRSRATVFQSLHSHPLHANLTRTLPQYGCSDPFQIEIERIAKLKVEASKLHEHMIMQLKSECNKEIEEIYKKYDILFQDAEIELVERKKELNAYGNKVFLNKLLAGTMILKQDYNEAAASPDNNVQSFRNLLIQQATQMPLRIGQPLALDLGAAPPLQVLSHSSICTAAPHLAPMTSSTVRAPAPHLRAFNPPSMSTPPVPTPSLVPNWQVHNNLENVIGHCMEHPCFQ